MDGDHQSISSQLASAACFRLQGGGSSLCRCKKFFAFGGILHELQLLCAGRGTHRATGACHPRFRSVFFSILVAMSRWFGILAPIFLRSPPGREGVRHGGFFRRLWVAAPVFFSFCKNPVQGRCVEGKGIS